MNGSAKRWPAANWSRFIDDVASRSGAQVVLVGAAGDAPLTEDVRRSSATAPVSLAGKTDIEALIGVIASADLLASGDSGPLHLAAAVGIPTLAVFGPNDPRVHGPFRPAAGGRLLRADIVCSPCYSLAATAECPLGDPICMRLVTPEPMVQAALELLHAVT
jgi:ADP-heptose:LPS heptosyltransferase